MKFYFDGKSFLKNFRSVLQNNEIQHVNIACSHIDLKGAKLLHKYLGELALERDNIIIYCSYDVDHQEPEKTLKLLNGIATVRIVDLKYLHSKVFEIQTDKYWIVYNGSCNFTTASLTENIELMTRQIGSEQELLPFWESLNPNSFRFEDTFIENFASFPKKDEQKWLEDVKQFKDRLMEIINTNDAAAEDAFFTDEDYAIFEPQYWNLNDTKTKLARKKTQQKFYELNEALLSFVNRHDLYPHYDSSHLTSSIVPSFYNNGEVHTIRIRYGKHEAEIKPFGSSKMESERSRSEKFGKHACLEFGIDCNEFYIGMFHSPANDGVDQSYVSDHWQLVKEKIMKVYDKLVGYGFYWEFWSNRKGRMVNTFDIDNGNPSQFIEFYELYFSEELVSYCRCYFQNDDKQIASFKEIVSLVEEHFLALLPLYNAMTYRIPKKDRLIYK